MNVTQLLPKLGSLRLERFLLCGDRAFGSVVLVSWNLGDNIHFWAVLEPVAELIQHPEVYLAGV